MVFLDFEVGEEVARTLLESLFPLQKSRDRVELIADLPPRKLLFSLPVVKGSLENVILHPLVNSVKDSLGVAQVVVSMEDHYRVILNKNLVHKQIQKVSLGAKSVHQEVESTVNRELHLLKLLLDE